MKTQADIQPSVEAKFGKQGNSYSLIVPKWFCEQWGMDPSKKYRILIQEEITEAKGLKTNAKTSRGMAVSFNLVRVDPPFSSYVGNYCNDFVISTD